jgi:hypothetical protein
MNYQISNLSSENIVINDIDSPIKKYDFIFCDLEDNPDGSFIGVNVQFSKF